LLLACSAFAQSTRFGQIDITAEPISSADTWHGYVEYRFVVRNTSKQQAHRVTLAIPDKGYASGESIRRLSRTITIGPGQRAMVSLFQPPLPISGSDVAVWVNGRRLGHVPRALGSHCIGGKAYGPSEVVVLLSRGINRQDFDRQGATMLNPEDESDANEPWRPGPSPGGGAGPQTPPFLTTVNEREVEAWSRSWLGYSRFAGVIMTPAEWTRAGAEVQQAITRYVECGGVVVMLGAWNAPAAWHADRSADGSYAHGFGRAIVIPEPDFKKWNKNTWKRLAESFEKTIAPLRNRSNVQSANRRLPVVEELGVPVRGLFVLMILFAVVIGPVNFIVLGRRNRRIWTLWTVPALSIFTSVMVFAYAFVAEGFTVHYRTETFTLLDQRTQHATTFGWAGLYAPLTPSGGIRLSPDAELTPQVELDYSDAGRQRTVNWTHTQHLDSGWIAARIPAHFTIRQSHTPRRERISTWVDQSGRLHAVNGLGTTVRRIRLADDAGLIHEARDIEPGADVVLNPPSHDLKVSRSEAKSRALYRGDWLSAADNVTMIPHNYLLPGTYIAEVAGSPFFELEIGGRIEPRHRSVVFGILPEATP